MRSTSTAASGAAVYAIDWETADWGIALLSLKPVACSLNGRYNYVKPTCRG